MKELFPNNPILFVDDEINYLTSVSMLLRINGITNTVTCNDSRKVIELLRANSFCAIFMDINMPYISGMELLKSINTEHPELPIIMLTAENSIDKAVDCIKAGAYDYMAKPVDSNRLIKLIKNITELEAVRNENRRLRNSLVADKLKNPCDFDNIITCNGKMLSIFKYVEAISTYDLPILITGNTGTGKNLLGEAIHKNSGRKGKFVVLNIAGEDRNTISDTLFGHRKGSFTGAIHDRKGLIEQAENGTLFFDEIGDLDMGLQVRLLRLIQNRKYYPIGSDIEKVSTARFIFATNKDIKQLVDDGKFRKDLFFRIKTHHIHIPDLKERPDDIAILAKRFFDKACTDLQKNIQNESHSSFTSLIGYSFPGNIRELENIVYDHVSRYEKGEFNIIPPGELAKTEEKTIANAISPPQLGECNVLFGNELPRLKDIEHLLIREALKRTGNNQTKAAKLLGISRKALNNRLSRMR